MKKQTGAAILFMTLILMVGMFLIFIYMANYSVLQTRTSANQYRNTQAFEAAEAGLEYALAFAHSNFNTVLANPTGGFINYTIPTTTQNDSSTYNVTITNPTANNFDVLNITSTGNSADNSATRVVTAQAYAVTFDNHAVMGLTTLTTGGNTSINGNVIMGQTVSQGSNTTITSITQNDPTLNAMSGNELFEAIFGMTKAEMQAQSTFYANTSFNPALLTGKNWINTEFRINGPVTVGTVTNPVLIIVNGDLIGTGTVLIYGMIYVTGSVRIAGTLDFHGGLVAEQDITLTGNSSFNQVLINPFVIRTYVKIPGSWRDF